MTDNTIIMMILIYFAGVMTVIAFLIYAVKNIIDDYSSAYKEIYTDLRDKKVTHKTTERIVSD